MERHPQLLETLAVTVLLKAQLNAAQKKYKPLFQAYITDQSVALGERWSFWCVADDALKGWDHTIPRSPEMRSYMDKNPPEYRGSHHTWEDLLNEAYLSDPDEPEAPFFYEDMAAEKIQEISALMEEILARNVRGFRYDW